MQKNIENFIELVLNDIDIMKAAKQTKIIHMSLYDFLAVMSSILNERNSEDTFLISQKIMNYDNDSI